MPGRPMLSSVAVGVNGKAGSGVLAAYSAWRRPLPPTH